MNEAYHYYAIAYAVLAAVLLVLFVLLIVLAKRDGERQRRRS